jgi:hypothetical protein
VSSATHHAALRRRGFALEGVTLGWNAVGVVVLAVAAIAARSAVLTGFGLETLIAIGMSAVVIWELSGAPAKVIKRASFLLGVALIALAVYLLLRSTLNVMAAHHARHSPLGIAWTAATAAAMFALAREKNITGRELDSSLLRARGRVTLVDGILALTVLAALILNATLDWWWASPLAAYLLVFCATRKAAVALIRAWLPTLPEE